MVDTSNYKDIIVKKTIALSVEDDKGVQRCYYLGYLILSENPVKDIISIEFDDFAANLVNK